ncbi:hypothetical protein ACFQV2_01725 [Actinokineospora soli]|uniref:Uncharacterized protein n=1 Tax=Actinokineospora soli TaxID=1048753 RepID=A0ABW2TH66_9PSEU
MRYQVMTYPAVVWSGDSPYSERSQRASAARQRPNASGVARKLAQVTQPGSVGSP